MAYMSTTDSRRKRSLGGRLPLLTAEEMSEEQRSLHDQIVTLRGGAAAQSGYVAALPDGRLIGPFNAMMRAPEIARGMLSWAGAISATLESAAIAPLVRETVILTVAAHRHSTYALYAHSRSARRAGLSEDAVDALVERRPPDDLPPAAGVAHRLARVLTEGTGPDDETYAEAVTTFGIPQVVALVSLIGQYLTTCAVLACFDVGAPEPTATDTTR